MLKRNNALTTIRTGSRLGLGLLTAALVLGLGSPTQAQVQSISLTGTSNIGPLNWAGGDWFVRAVLLDATDTPVGNLSNELSFNLDGNQVPRVTFTMTATAPTDHKLRVYRSSSTISVGDPNVESFDLACTSAACDATSPTELTLGENLAWAGTTVLPVELESFSVASLVEPRAGRYSSSVSPGSRATTSTFFGPKSSRFCTRGGQVL